MASLEEAISVLGDTSQARGRRCLAVKAICLLGDDVQRRAADAWRTDPSLVRSWFWAVARVQTCGRRELELDSRLRGLRENADQLEYWEDAKEIGYQRARRATRPLIGIVEHSAEPDRRAAALHALWLLADPRSTPLCLRVAADARASAKERIIAVEALGVGAHRQHVQRALARYLSDPLPMVRYSALCAAGQTRGGRLGPELRAALRLATADTVRVYEDGDIARFAAELLAPA